MTPTEARATYRAAIEEERSLGQVMIDNALAWLLAAVLGWASVFGIGWALWHLVQMVVGR